MGIGKASRRRSLLALAASAVGGLCCSAFAQVADPGNLYYQTPATSISSMCCYGVNQANLANTEVSSTQFASWVGNAFDPGGVPDIHDADFLFQQCYSGGMFGPLINAMGAVPWAGGSASSYWQCAQATPSPFPGVIQPQYATWSAGLVPQMYNNPNQPVKTDAAIAQQQDYYGPNSAYYQLGILGEDPNYLSYNGGNTNTVADQAVTNLGGTHYAVIFVGDMGLYGTQGDFSKLGQSMRNVSADLIKTLSADWAHTNFQIYLLFGDGTSSTLGFNSASSIGANTGLNMVTTINNPANNYNTTILPATSTNLSNVIQAIGNAPNSIDNQFLFFGFDHGDRQIIPQRLALAGPNSPAGGQSDPPVSAGSSYTTSFSLTDPSGDPTDNPNDELVDTADEEDPSAPSTLTVTYSGLDTNATGEVDVMLNGDEIGTLDPTGTSVTLDVPAADLEDGDTLSIDNNTDETVNVLSESFDAGAVPPEDGDQFVPEPAAASIALLGVGLLSRRRRAVKCA
jgi:hypothetical protein